MTTTKDALGFDQVAIAQEFEYAVAAGELPHAYFEFIAGRNPDITTAVEDIWSQGGIMSWPTTSSAIFAWSSAATDADTTTASGARKIRVEGLLDGFTAASEDISMNGAATVTSINSYRRINRVSSLEVGTYDGTISPMHGTISISHGSTITAQLYIDGSITGAISQAARFTVPAGYDAYITKVNISVATGKSSDVYIFKRENANDVTAPFSPKKVIMTLDGVVGFNPINLDHYRLPAKTDLWVSAKAAGAGSSVSVLIDLLLKRTL